MQVNPYLYYNGNCEAAFKYYEKALGAKIEMMMTHRERAARHADPAGLEEEDHARPHIDRWRGADGLRCASRPLPSAAGVFGLAAWSTIPPTPSASSRRYPRAAASTWRLRKTFFAKGFGMCVDQFGIPWMVMSPAEQ